MLLEKHGHSFPFCVSITSRQNLRTHRRHECASLSQAQLFMNNGLGLFFPSFFSSSNASFFELAYQILARGICIPGFLFVCYYRVLFCIIPNVFCKAISPVAHLPFPVSAARLPHLMLRTSRDVGVYLGGKQFVPLCPGFQQDSGLLFFAPVFLGRNEDHSLDKLRRSQHG